MPTAGKMNVVTFFRAAVVIVSTLTYVGAVCTGGIEGIEAASEDICCVEDCGVCGGTSCDPGANSTLTAADCCTSNIENAGVYCVDTGVAPCILTAVVSDDNSTCSNGLSGFEDTVEGICCDLACGLCGGTGCGNVVGLTGNDCCSTTIASNGTLCSVAGEAPCIIDTPEYNSTCSNDLAGFEDTVEGVCCALGCGLCGGAGCGSVAGLTGNDCCSTTIASSGTLCSVTGEAPCIIDIQEVTYNSTCSNDLAGFEDSVEGVCCDVGCGLCGGAGCGNVAGLTGNDCCSTTIASNGTLCSVAGEAPCIIDIQDYNSTCSNDFAGFEDTVEGVCCDVGCGLCGGAGCGNVVGLTGNDCCSTTIASNGTLCSVAGEAPCIIDIPEVTYNSTCSNDLAGFEDTVEGICCDVGCGLCGGTGCGNVAGLTGNDCCSATIASNGTLCSVAGEAPCIIDIPDVTYNSTCSNDLAGFEDTVEGVCCALGCGLCGGTGCGNVAGLTGNDCCSATIASNGTLCSVAGEAPCIIDIPDVTYNSTCSNDLAGFEDTVEGVCCALGCGLCGGTGCGNVAGLTGNDCCSATIASNGTLCSVTGEAPCIIDIPETTYNNTCSNGLDGFEDIVDGACCVLACGQCGGAGCGNIAGLTGDDCCSETIASNGTPCSVTGEAPCVLDLPDVIPSTCPNGLSGVQNGDVCCAEACNGVCGGSGCGSIAGTEGSSDCCSATISQAGVYCEDGVVAPCIMVNGTYTPAPSVILRTAAPTAIPRSVSFTSQPTFEGQTMSPTAVMTSSPTSAPTSTDRGLASAAPTASTTTTTSSPGLQPSVSPTSQTEGPTTSGAASPSTGNLVTLAALVAGTFAVFAAARD